VVDVSAAVALVVATALVAVAFVAVGLLFAPTGSDDSTRVARFELLYEDENGAVVSESGFISTIAPRGERMLLHRHPEEQYDDYLLAVPWSRVVSLERSSWHPADSFDGHPAADPPTDDGGDSP